MFKRVAGGVLVIGLLLLGGYLILRPIEMPPELQVDYSDLPPLDVTSFQLNVPVGAERPGWQLRGERMVADREAVLYLETISGHIERFEQGPLYFLAPYGYYDQAAGNLKLPGSVHIYDDRYSLEMGSMEWDEATGEIIGRETVVFRGPDLQITGECATVKIEKGKAEYVVFSGNVEGYFANIPFWGEELLFGLEEGQNNDKAVFYKGRVTILPGEK